jgi:hypothetical protein
MLLVICYRYSLQISGQHPGDALALQYPSPIMPRALTLPLFSVNTKSIDLGKAIPVTDFSNIVLQFHIQLLDYGRYKRDDGEVGNGIC